MSTGTLSNRPDRPEMTRRTIEPAQQTAARVVGFTFLERSGLKERYDSLNSTTLT